MSAKTPKIELWQALRHPAAQTLRLHDEGLRPWPVWLALTAIAVLGSFLYGASLALAFAGFDPFGGAAWIALSAGLGWCVFGPGLVLLSARSPWSCAHACMIAMAWGEALLFVGAIVNAALWLALGADSALALPFNLALFVVANITMGAVVDAQMRALGVPSWKTVVAWLVLLDGVGAAFFFVLSGWLEG